MSFAIFGAVSKIITYATGGDVPELVFGPMLIYTVLMMVICFGLAFWHRYNWKRSGCQSELLSTETRAAVIDGIISAGAGGGLLGAARLRSTPLEFLVPISDSIIVLTLCVFIIRQPLKMFYDSLREVAGGAADPALIEKARKLTEEMTSGLSVEVLAVSVMKLGRNYFVVPYLKPEGAVNAEQIDSFRHDLETAFKKLFGQVKTEAIITAERPYLS